MNKVLFLFSLLTITNVSFASEKSVTGNLNNLKQSFTMGQMKAVSFNTGLGYELVIECYTHSGAGIIGLSKNYVGYNMLIPGKLMQKNTCLKAVDYIYSGGSVVFTWENLGCTYGQCEYNVSYQLK